MWTAVQRAEKATGAGTPMQEACQHGSDRSPHRRLFAMGRGAPRGVGVGTGGGRGAVLTVLFTDIEGSTALTERLGDERWVQVLSAHDVAIRSALRDKAGLEVKTVGDGFLAVFRSAAAAVRAGADIQRLVAAIPVPELPGGLRIRVGAHRGPVILVDGDVLGRSVHVARRIASVAEPGQVLVSASVKVLVEQSSGLRVGVARSVVLRGISEPQVVFDMSVAEPRVRKGALTRT